MIANQPPSTSPEPDNPVNARGFAGFAALQSRHIDLARRRTPGEPTPEFLAEVEDFLRQVQATGRVIADDDERIAAQSIIDYWTTVLLRARHVPPETELAEFSPSPLLESLPSIPSARDYSAERGAVRRRMRLSAAAAQWNESKRDKTLLWGGAHLAQAAQYEDLTDVERDFVLYSQQDEAQTARLKKTVKRAAITAALLIVGLVCFSLWRHLQAAKIEADIATANADIATAKADAAILRAQFEANEKKIETANRISLAHQFALYHVERAAVFMRYGDVASALFSFTEALDKDRSAEMPEAIHHLRIGAALAQLPRLAQLIPEKDTALRNDFVQLSSDGGLLLIAANRPDDSAGAVSIWNVITGEGKVLTKSDGRVNSAAFSPREDWTRSAPSERLVLVASGQSGAGKGRLRIWDDEGTERKGFDDIQTPVLAACFSPEGGRVAFAREIAKDNCVVEIRNCKADLSGEVGLQFPWAGTVKLVAFSPGDYDGQRGIYLLVAGTLGDRGAFQVWHAWEGHQVAKTREATQDLPIECAAFSPDDRHVVTGSGDGPDGERGEIRVWETFSGFLRVAGEHRGLVAGVAFSPDGRRVVSAGYDGQARVWDVARNRMDFDLTHQSSVYAAAFSPDGRFLVTGSRDRTARVWNTSTGRPALPPLYHDSTVFATSFSEDGQRVVTATRGAVRLWRMATGEPTPPVFKLDGRVLRAALSADGQRVAVVGVSGEVRAGSVAGGEDSPPRPAAFRPDNAFFSPDARLVLLTAATSTKILRTDQTPPPPPLDGLEGAVRYAAFSPEGKYVLTFSEKTGEKSARTQVWIVETGKLEKELTGVAGDVVHAVFTPDEAHVLIAGGSTSPKSGQARVWEVATGQPATPPFEHLEKVLHASFDSTAERVITASADDTAKVWKVRLEKNPSGKAEQFLLADGKKIHTADVTYAAFSNDGKWALTASYDRSAIIWNTTTGKVRTILDHPGAIRDANFDKDGKFVVTCGSDSSAQVWDAETGDFVARFQHAAEVTRAFFNAQGDVLTLCPSEPVRAVPREAPAAAAGPESNPARGLHETMMRVRVWRFSTAKISLKGDDALAGFKSLAQLLRAQTAGPETSPKPVRVEREEVPGIWEKAKSKYPDQSYFNEEGPAPGYAAEESEAAGDWFAAAWHLQRRLLVAGPGNEQEQKLKKTELLVRKARALGSGGRWEAALEDYFSALVEADDLLTKAGIQAAISNIYADTTGTGDRSNAHLFANLAIQAGTTDPNVYLLRASDFAAKDQWKEAAGDLEKALELKPDLVLARAKLATVRLKEPNPNAYREVCAKLLRDFSADEYAPNTVWACVLGKDVLDEAGYAQLIELARNARADNRSYRYLNTLGAVYFRAGKLDDAILTLRKAREAYAAYPREADAAYGLPKGRDPEKEVGRPVDWLFLAMAHAARRDAAKTDPSIVEKGVDDAKQAAAYLERERKEILNWRNFPDKRIGWPYLNYEILRAEAESMILEKK
jgi:WD40 repeat protein